MSNIFSISHESKNYAEWDSQTNPGDLDIVSDAALAGTVYGLEVTVDDSVSHTCEKNMPGSYNETIRFRFHFDPNGLTMAEGDYFYLARIIRANPSVGLFCSAQLQYESGYKAKANIQHDGGGTLNRKSSVLTDGPHYFEIKLTRASGSAANDGTLYAYIDGSEFGSITNWDNYDSWLGLTSFVAGISGRDAGTSGVFYLDEFLMRDDDTLIGPANAVSSSDIFAGPYDGNLYLHAGFTTTIRGQIPKPGTYAEGRAWDGDLFLGDDAGAPGSGKFYRLVGFNGTIRSSFSVGTGIKPGCAWDGANLYTADYTAAHGSERAFKYTGFSSTVSSSFTLPSGSQYGVTLDHNLNFITVDRDSDKVTRFSGFTSSVDTSFTRANLSGSDASWDGTDLFVSSMDDNKYYKLTGFSSTVSSSITQETTNGYGLAVAGMALDVTAGLGEATAAGLAPVVGPVGNIIVANYAGQKHVRFRGFTSTVDSSYTTGDSQPYGLGHDGTNVFSTGNGNDKLFKHNGFSSSYITSINAPTLDPTAICWDGSTMLSGSWHSDKLYKHVGFTTSIASSFGASEVRGVEWNWDDDKMYHTRGDTATNVFQHNGFSSSIDSSFNGPNWYGAGVAWMSSSDLSWASYSTNIVYQLTGFSSTVKNSFNDSFGGAPTGTGDIAWDNWGTTDPEEAVTATLWHWLNTHVRHRVRR